jgi:hypothetical protein
MSIEIKRPAAGGPQLLLLNLDPRTGRLRASTP